LVKIHLYIIRHGQSLENIGQATTPNCGLSPLGEVQSKLIAKFFGNMTINTIFCSPFRRVIQTASPLSDEKDVPIILIPEMSEIFTEFLGAPLKQHYPWEISSQIIKEFPYSAFREPYTANPNWWPKQWPETMEHVRARISMFYDNELQPLFTSNDHVVVFGHGASTDALKMKVCPDAQYPEIVETNAITFEYVLDANGNCSAYKTHLDFLGEHASPKSTGYGAFEPLR